MSFVYLWINNVNNMRYIGSHVGKESDGYQGSGPKFKEALKEFGEENFSRNILEFVEDKTTLRQVEQKYLDFYGAAKNPNFYNSRPTATGGFCHINDNPLLRKKANEAHKGKWDNKEHPRGMKGKRHTEEVKRQIKESSKEAAKTRKYQPPKPIIQYDLEGNVLYEHDSLSDAAKFVNGGASNIKYCADGMFKTSYKYKWKWKES